MSDTKGVYKALLKVQSEITNPGNTAVNPFFKSKYAPLPDILNLVRPLLNKHGLILIQNTGSNDEGLPFVQTILLDAEGDGTVESEKLILRPEKKSVQGIGSAITYGRRYQLSALLGISSEDDNDGNGGEEPKQVQKKNPGQPKKQPKTTSKAQPKTGKKQPKTGKKQPGNKPKPKPTPAKGNEPETMDMTNGDHVNLTELQGINTELDKWITMHRRRDTHHREICEICETLLGNQDMKPEEFREIKKALGMPVK